MDLIQSNLTKIHSQIISYANLYHKNPESIKLLAVSKHQSIEKISTAIACGQICFGESYLQEALLKIEYFADKNLEWHFIGPIQSNKTKKIAEHFSWVQSLDSEKIAKRLNEQRPDHLPPLNICLQINISNEETKSGIAPSDILELAKTCSELPRLKLRGLMAIPAPSHNLREQRSQLHKLKLIYDDLCKKDFLLDTLSMGMSDDMEAAIAENSTLLRIGTAIFGSRDAET